MAWLDTIFLKSSSPRMRCRAVENLSSSKRPSDTELLFASLHDPDGRVRCAAVRALARKKAPEAQKSLVGALKDPNFEVRVAAARALGQMKAADCANALAASLRDPDATVRLSAAGALRSIGWKPSTKDEIAWFELALGSTPAAVPAQDVPPPDEDVRNRDTAFYRRVAAETLREKNDPRRIQLLLAQVRGHDSLVRLSAIHDLGEVNDPQATQVLLDLFRDPDKEVRLAAAKVLATREDSPPAHFLGLLQDSSSEVRLAAVQFLGRIRHEQIVHVLSPLLSDPCSQVREATATALVQMGDCVHC